jgi:hypothetical protein
MREGGAAIEVLGVSVDEAVIGLHAMCLTQGARTCSPVPEMLAAADDAAVTPLRRLCDSAVIHQLVNCDAYKCAVCITRDTDD